MRHCPAHAEPRLNDYRIEFDMFFTVSGGLGTIDLNEIFFCRMALDGAFLNGAPKTS